MPGRVHDHKIRRPPLCGPTTKSLIQARLLKLLSDYGIILSKRKIRPNHQEFRAQTTRHTKKE